MTDARIVTTHYRYKPPPRKRKAAPLAGPAVVTPITRPTGRVARPIEPKQANDDHQSDDTTSDLRTPSDDTALPQRRPTIVTAHRPGKRYADVPDLPPEEHQRRGDAADAVWRELVRRATGKDRP
jgi:hypothetical protein